MCTWHNIQKVYWTQNYRECVHDTSNRKCTGHKTIGNVYTTQAIESVPGTDFSNVHVYTKLSECIRHKKRNQTLTVQLFSNTKCSENVLDSKYGTYLRAAPAISFKIRDLPTPPLPSSPLISSSFLTRRNIKVL